MTVLGTLPNDKAKLVGLYVNENSKYQTNLSSLDVQKRIAQDVNESPERRAAAKAKYEELSKKVKEGADKIDKLQKAVDKLEGGKEVTKIQAEYKKLAEAKSLLLDPNDPEAETIDKKIDALATKYQNAYSKVVGTRVSKAVAKGALTGGGAATFGQPSEDTGAPNVTLSELKLPSEKKSTTSKPSVPKGPGIKAAQLPNEPATTVNPVTGERIKVSDIKPAGEGATASKPAVGPGISDVTDEKTAAALGAAAAIDLAGTLFNHVPSLKNLLDQYVQKGWTNTRFLQELRNDNWYKKNSAEIKQRYVQLYNYQDLVASGQADGSTDYEKQIATLERQLADKARKMGSNAASDPAALRRAAENMYITNVGIDDALTTDLLAAAIKPIAGMIGGKVTQGYSGEALANYQTLVQTARDNGFQLSDILPGGANEQQVLAGIASGKIDINRVQQDARKLAAQGQPQYVRDLLAQGYDLAQVFAPYRKVMGTVLEVNPDQIDLNDPLLRTAITDKGDMNLYDFKKALRQDNRWQYTEQAKADVSQAAYNVLKDFGFQG